MIDGGASLEVLCCRYSIRLLFDRQRALEIGKGEMSSLAIKGELNKAESCDSKAEAYA